MKKLIGILPILALLIACEPSTKIIKSWRDPSASVDIKGVNKILVVGLVKDESSRRIVEDKLVSLMKVKGVQSYTYLKEDVGNDNGKLAEMLKKDGFNGVLVMRLVDVEKETSYVQGSTTAAPGYYGSYYGYYRYASPMYSSPGYYQTDKHYTVETTVYSTVPDKLIWSATTTTLNPTKFEETIQEIATAVAEKMRQDGFVKG